MAPQSRRYAALLVSVHVDPQGSPPWYARLSSYQDAFSFHTLTDKRTTEEGVCEAVLTWLRSVLKSDGTLSSADPSVTDQ